MKTIDESLMRVIQNTGTEGHQKKIRPLNLIEIAEDIVFLKEKLGSMQTVSERINLSSGMLNRFLKVFNLHAEVIEMIRKREIDSISVVNSLASFSKDDQISLAKLIINNEINSQDLKVLSPYRKQFLNENILDVVEKFQQSKNIKVSVINFHLDDLHKDKEKLKIDLCELIGEQEVVSVSFFDSVGTIKITKKGEKTLRSKAKEANQTLQTYTYSILQ